MWVENKGHIMGKRNNPRTVQAADTTCDLLLALKDLNGAGITELADNLDRSKGGIHSQLATLHQNGFVVKRGGEYHLSLLFYTLGEFVKNNLDQGEVNLQNLVTDELNSLAEDTGELAQFGMEENGELVFIFQSMGDRAIRSYSRAGRRDDLHCTALGKAILAHLPRSQVEEIIEQRGLPRRTENTLSTREELLDNLDTVRERGYSFNEVESRLKMRAVGAPVLRDGEVFGAVSVSGPANRIKGDFYKEEIPDILLAAADAIEVKLAYPDNQ